MKGKTYLALGDSYTIGESVSTDERFPVQLVDSLKKRHLQVDSLKIIAKTGWTTDELMQALDTSNTGSQYDLVTLLIGVNNQYRGRDMNNYRQEFTTLLDSAIALGGGQPAHVIVLSIPDWGITPFARNRKAEKISKEIDAFNVINKTISTQKNVHYIDITGISRKAENDSSLLAGDGLHPSGKMYALWVEKLIPVASNILSEQK